MDLNLFAPSRIHPDDIDTSVFRFQKAISAQTLFTSEHRLLGCDGIYRWFMIKANPYLDAVSKKVIRWYGTSVDVQGQHDAEKKLWGLNSQLESQIAEGSRDLEAAEDQVRQLQKLEALGQLTGGVAHDFNNMLTVIRNAADLLRIKTLPEEKRRGYLDLILDTSNRAAKLTGRLLAFARKQVVKPEVFSVTHRVEEIAEMLQRMVGAQVDIAVDAQTPDCYVQADQNQFEIALMNLVVNARDAMEGEGKIEITVTEGEHSEAKRPGEAYVAELVTIAVADTGHGIDPEHLEKIFEPFFTTKDLGKGTGLGLSQVHGFAQQSGGEVSVQSTPGEGSIFSVTLPTVKSSPSQEAVADGRSVPGPRTKILIVEDNREVGEFTAKLLSEFEFEADVACDASSALRYLEQFYDSTTLVLSDVVMPGKNGIELGKEIRQRWPQIGVVLTSGYSQTIAEEALDEFAMLAKPYSITQLLNALSKANDRRGTS